MYTAHIWNKLNLLGKKTILALSAIFILISSSASYAQEVTTINLPNYDQRWLHYGFTIGLHSSYFSLKYNDRFVSPQMDSVHSIQPPRSFGFSLGFIVNLRLAQYADLRLLPKVSFYEHKLEYNFTDPEIPTQSENVETTVVEFPLLVKFKSQRRKNGRMYLVGGITPGIEATGKKEEGEDDEKLPIRGGNVSFEVGVGIDIYYPLFKFSPELRYSAGLINMLKPEDNPLSAGLDRLTTHSVTLYLQFE